MGNSDHIAVSVSIDFPLCSQRDALFHHVAYDYSCADCNRLCDHLRDVPWEDIFKLCAPDAASEFCEWVQVGIDVFLYLFSLLELNLKLHDISVTTKMVKKAIMSIGLSKASGLDCIPVVVLKNC